MPALPTHHIPCRETEVRGLVQNLSSFAARV